MNLGSYTLETALLLRNSVLLNGMLTNTEVWYHLGSSETEVLEKIDRNFFLKVLGLPHSVPKAALYLETGSMQLEIVIKVRRLIYFHTIINNSESSMLYKVFLVQWLFPCKGD